MTQVSVVIPAYNATATLDRTLASVCAQTHTDLEVIVVDDGSTDETADLALRHAQADSRIQVITKENAGVAAARNHGIKIATCAWVAPIDADDVWHPKTIEGFLSAAEAAPEPVVFVYTWSRRIDETDRLIVDLGSPRYTGDVVNQILVANFTSNASATMIDRRAALSIGGYDSGLLASGAQGAEDIDLYLRLAHIGPAAVSEGFHVGYRQMPEGMSQSVDRMRSSIELVLEKLERENMGLHPKLYSLARTNYDIYAAGLCISNGSWINLLRYSGKALVRKTLLASLQLLVYGPYSLIIKLKTSQMPKFEELDTSQACSWPVRDFIASLQDHLYKKILRAPRINSI